MNRPICRNRFYADIFLQGGHGTTRAWNRVSGDRSTAACPVFDQAWRSAPAVSAVLGWAMAPRLVYRNPGTVGWLRDRSLAGALARSVLLGGLGCARALYAIGAACAGDPPRPGVAGRVPAPGARSLVSRARPPPRHIVGLSRARDFHACSRRLSALWALAGGRCRAEMYWSWWRGHKA